MNKIKLITFDATGTLIKFKKAPVETYLEFGKKHGVFCKQEEIQTNFKKSWKELNRENPHFGKDWQQWWTEFIFRTFQVKNAELAADLISYFSSGTAYEWQKDALQTLSKLKSYELGIISNSDPRLKNVLKTLDCPEGRFDDDTTQIKAETLFSKVFLSHECQISKPDRKIFDLARGIFNSSECLHIGDNLELDYLAAKNAGWNSVHYKGDFNQLIHQLK